MNEIRYHFFFLQCKTKCFNIIHVYLLSDNFAFYHLMKKGSITNLYLKHCWINIYPEFCNHSYLTPEYTMDRKENVPKKLFLVATEEFISANCSCYWWVLFALYKNGWERLKFQTFHWHMINIPLKWTDTFRMFYSIIH